MLRKVLIWPDPILRKKSEEVTSEHFATGVVKKLAMDLTDTMLYHNKLGLSAIQIGIPLRIFAIQSSNGSEVWVNPYIVYRSSQKEAMKESCPSLLGVCQNIARNTFIDVEGLDENEILFKKYGMGEWAQAIQHEIDHLNGKMWSDKLKPEAKERLRAHIHNSNALL